MSFLQTIKFFLGLDGGRGEPARSDPAVRVEREPSAETERAVKEGAASTDTATRTPRAPQSAGGTGTDEADGPAAAETTDEPDETADTATPAGEAASAPAADESDADDEDPSVSVEEINGIGPTYADRLSAAGIETVADLADSDAETVADAAETSPSRVEDWLAQARAD